MLLVLKNVAQGCTRERDTGSHIGILAEWLRRQTRNLVGSALVGSNPADVVSVLRRVLVSRVRCARALCAFGIMAEWLRRQTRNLVGSALVGSNPADVEFFFSFFQERIVLSGLNNNRRQSICVHSTRVVFNPSKVKIRVRVPVNASWGIVVHGSIQPSQG